MKEIIEQDAKSLRHFNGDIMEFSTKEQFVSLTLGFIKHIIKNTDVVLLRNSGNFYYVATSSRQLIEFLNCQSNRVPRNSAIRLVKRDFGYLFERFPIGLSKVEFL